MSLEIWRDAVTSYLRSKGINEWCEGKVAGGYAIWGSPEVMQELQNFNVQYLKSSIRHGVIPELGQDKGMNLIDSAQRKQLEVIKHEK